MSSPIASTFQPGMVGIIIDKLVLPQAEGKAPVIYFTRPDGLISFRINMCSAIQPSSRACTDAMRSAWHFFASSALPPYPEPYDQISRVSGKWQMYFCSGLQRQVLSGSLGPSGKPTECSPRTQSPSSPRASSTRLPTLDIMCMLTTTYAESVISTPIFAIGEPIGPRL